MSYGPNDSNKAGGSRVVGSRSLSPRPLYEDGANSGVNEIAKRLKRENEELTKLVETLQMREKRLEKVDSM